MRSPQLAVGMVLALTACGGDSTGSGGGGTGTPPAGLAYSQNPAVYTQGTAIPPNVPTNTGGTVSGYSVTPALPPGLSLSTATGVIGGTPTAVTQAANYTVTATNASGSTTAILSVAVAWGNLIGTFAFAGSQILSPNDCFFANPGSPAYQVRNPIGFSGDIFFAADGSDRAALFLVAPHSVPRLGTHTGYDIDLFYVNSTVNVGSCTCPNVTAVTAGRCLCPPGSPLLNCSCPVTIEERTRGTMNRDPSGRPLGFTGSLTNSVTPPSGVALPNVCDCHVACSYSYALSATVVNAP